MAAVTLAHLYAGTIGVSLLRRWYDDGEFNEARMIELADVIREAGEFPLSLELNPTERDVQQGYSEWADSYDGPNPLVDAETPIVRRILERFGGPGIIALDAGCGTGRHAEWLAQVGCDTTGIDRSTAMLEHARAKVSGARFVHGNLERLPFDDGTFHLLVISLTLCHLADPTNAIAEAARVLRRGGALVVTDPHPSAALLGGQAFYGGVHRNRPLTWVRNHHHAASVWLAAFRAAGLVVDDCQEPPFTEEQITTSPLYGRFPEATRAALEGLPGFWLWVCRLP